jgi:hypothetical protein
MLRSGGNVDDDQAVEIAMQEPVTLTFALRYLNFFTKVHLFLNQSVACKLELVFNHIYRF